MGKHPWLKIECLPWVDDPESKRLKAAALNLFHPTASPFSERPRFHITTQAPREEGKGEGFFSLLNDES
jgi:hypothetical protein